jgi:hypothetical protein
VRRGGLTRVAGTLERNDMRLLGIDRTAQIARWANRKRRPFLDARRRAYEGRFDELLDENGWQGGERRIEMADGFALDSSQTLPYLDRLIAEMNPVIEERGLIEWRDQQNKPFLQNILEPDGAFRYPSLTDFAACSEVVSAVAPAFGYIPHLSSNVPRGVRLQESSTVHDPTPTGPWRASQLWHLDYHTFPTVYVITLIRDVTEDSGPLCWISASASRRVAEAYDYRSRGAPYRITDEQFFAVVEPSEVLKLTGPPGTTLFIDSSVCFHMGSRNAVVPRYQVQYAYASPVKNDFSEILRESFTFPLADSDSTLRRMILDRDWLLNADRP